MDLQRTEACLQMDMKIMLYAVLAEQAGLQEGFKSNLTIIETHF